MGGSRVLICMLGSTPLILGGCLARLGSLWAACGTKKESCSALPMKSALRFTKHLASEFMQHDERPPDEASVHKEDGMPIAGAKYHEERQPPTPTQNLTESGFQAAPQHYEEQQLSKSMRNDTWPPKLCTQQTAERFRVKSIVAASDWPTNSTEHDGDFCIAGKGIPRLFVLGAQKAGTTSIAHDLFKAGFSSPQDEAPRQPLKELHSFDSACGWLSPERCVSVCPTMTESMRLEWAAGFKYPCDKKGLVDCTPVNFRLAGLPQMLKDLYGPFSLKLRHQRYVSVNTDERGPVRADEQDANVHFWCVLGGQMHRALCAWCKCELTWNQKCIRVLLSTMLVLHRCRAHWHYDSASCADCQCYLIPAAFSRIPICIVKHMICEFATGSALQNGDSPRQILCARRCGLL